MPAVIQKAVKTGILALIWIDVGLVAAVRGPQTAAVVAAIWIPAFLLGRWLILHLIPSCEFFRAPGI